MPLPVIWIIKALLPLTNVLGITSPLWERHCRYLNQRLYLFPHKTVGGNLSLAKPESTRQEQLDLLALLNIDTLIDRYPHQLSGGEQQRAALARR